MSKVFSVKNYLSNDWLSAIEQKLKLLKKHKIISKGFILLAFRIKGSEKNLPSLECLDHALMFSMWDLYFLLQTLM